MDVRHAYDILLVPTEPEYRRLMDLGGFGDRRVELIGFGPIAAAASVARLCAESSPRGLMLVGIAGAYDTDLHPPGTALGFGAVEVDGIGVGEGPEHIGPTSLGFPQLPVDAFEPRAEERLKLFDPLGSGGILLTTCAASATEAHANERLVRHPEAVAEDMEAYAAALACRAAGVPLTVVRGISNRVGEREPSRWVIPAALAAARRVALECLEASEAGVPSAGAGE